jgi:hypothetical protein
VIGWYEGHTEKGFTALGHPTGHFLCRVRNISGQAESGATAATRNTQKACCVTDLSMTL